MTDINSLLKLIKRGIEIGFNLPRSGTFDDPQEIFGLVNRKKLMQDIYFEVFGNESFTKYIDKCAHKNIDFPDVLIQFVSNHKGFRFSADKFMICSVENESDIYKVIIPLHKENIELFLYGIIPMSEPSRVLDWAEYGFISKSKLSTKESKIHKKFSYSLEKGKNGQKEITAEQYFFLCLLEDAALKSLSKINNIRLDQSKYNRKQIEMVRMWSIMMVDCHSQNYIDIERSEKDISICKDWSTFDSFVNWLAANNMTDQIAFIRSDRMQDFSPDNCIWRTDIDIITESQFVTPERYYWHYYDHQFYSTTSIRKTPITIHGVERPLLDWSAIYNIPGHIIIGRVYSGLKDDDLVTPVVKRTVTYLYKEITIDGTTRTVKEWASVTGIPVNTIISRIRYGWRGADLIAPPRSRNK
ncbi:hypothetical protein ACFVS2_26760 [Brevibacillus sp. NPDC058079]|uniref:hypothetical protein n=1 Tax=Brevibacillus sp. NPDC058079 TaxID=3346330 RepID=UPI0036E006FC